ncbi:MAG: hypothetical protein Q8J69_01045 [Sphingobacteriaceae bacterium]|nr:hypothetical protein [Sphingobacteriaceae bacterium]
MRLLLFVFLSLPAQLLYGQSNELDQLYTPPSSAKFSQAKRIKGSGEPLFARASDAPFLYALKYDLTKGLRGHHQLGFEMSINDWLSIEPLLGVLSNKTDMFITNNNLDGWAQLSESLDLGFGRYAATALDYQSLLSWADPRRNAVPSLGFQLNLFSNDDRQGQNVAYMLQLGYQFQHMRYTLSDTISRNFIQADSRDGFMRRQQVNLFLGAQMLLGERLPFVVEYGVVVGMNIFTAPTFSRTNITGNNNAFNYQKLDYASSYVPVIGFRLKVGLGFNPAI